MTCFKNNFATEWKLYAAKSFYDEALERFKWHCNQTYPKTSLKS